jgi:hypothetical protein
MATSAAIDQARKRLEARHELRAGHEILKTEPVPTTGYLTETNEQPKQHQPCKGSST